MIPARRVTSEQRQDLAGSAPPDGRESSSEPKLDGIAIEARPDRRSRPLVRFVLVEYNLILRRRRAGTKLARRA
jgi:hypothetical protein